MKENIRIDSKKLFSRILADTYGPFSPKSFKEEEYERKEYFITTTDTFSRFLRVYFATSATGENVVRYLKKWTKCISYPQTLISDNGTKFKNKHVKNYTNNCGIKHVFIPTYAPFANGIGERIDRTLTEVIKTNKGKSIKDARQKINFRINENIHRGLGISPNSIIQKLNSFDKKRQIKYELKINTTLNNTSKFKIGKEIYTKNFNTNYSTKEYLGPYRISEIGNKGR